MELSKRKAAFLAAAALAAGLLCGVAVAGNPHGTPPGQQQTTSSSDNSAGVKPSSTTQHDTHAQAGSNKTKLYGNGKTAGQIAEQKGASPTTDLYGPGNSQPHKICGRDVHAYKGTSDKKCPSGTSSTASANIASSTAAGSTAGVTAGTVTGTRTGTSTGTGTSASSSNPSASGGVLGSSHSLSKPVTSGAKPANAARGTATFTG